MMARGTLIWAILTLTGCYLAHEIPEPGAQGVDVGVDTRTDIGIRAPIDLSVPADSGRFDADGPPVDAGALDYGTPDAGSPDLGADLGRPDAGPSCATDRVDLLLVIDNSGSMRQEQAALAQELPALVAALATGDINGDGDTTDLGERPLHVDVQVGVVTTDLGSGPVLVSQACEVTGDDAIIGANNVAVCGTNTASYAPGDDLGSFVDAASCLIDVGTNGCALEAPLEATRRAIAPATDAFSLVQRDGEGTPLVVSLPNGAPDGANAAFFREDALLVVYVLTDEDDCSSEELALYDALNSNNPYFPVPMVGDNIAPELQCATYPNALLPVDRVVDGLLAGRPMDTTRTLVAFVAGVPPDALDAGDGWQVLLDDPRMRNQPNPNDPSRLSPSCTRPDPAAPNDPTRINQAFPARRLVQTARALERAGVPVVFESICRAVSDTDHRADFSRATAAILDAVVPCLR